MPTDVELRFPSHDGGEALVPTLSAGVLITEVFGPAQDDSGGDFALAKASGDSIMMNRGHVVFGQRSVYQMIVTEELTPGGLPFNPNDCAPLVGRLPIALKVHVQSAIGVHD